MTSGIEPVVGFLGKSVFFTDLDNVAVETLFYPKSIRWFSADLHHHSNILDGVTPPRDLVQSQLAARLDFTLVSDHDSIANNVAVRDLSKSRGVPFISANEISPIWAHFVTYRVNLLTPVLVDPAGTAQEIFDQAHAAGMTISIAHPYIAYGYFTADEADAIPGRYSDDFDFIEIQSTRVTAKGTSPDERTLAKAYELWTGALTNQNKKHYLTGGYDVHDVWAHVSTGPLMRPYYFNFGDTKAVKKSNPRVSFDIRGQAAYGLKKIEVVRNGKVIRSLTFGDETTAERVVFSIKNVEKSWYCFIVEDVNGDRAISNPVWTRMTN